MHVGGMGDETTLATGVGKVFAKLKETAGGKGEVPTRRHRSREDDARRRRRSTRCSGYKGELKDGVYKVVIGRTTKMGGHTVGKAMGVNTWAAFAGSDDKAVVDGDFAMLESELQPVLKALRGGGIDIVAIHKHMTGEQPAHPLPALLGRRSDRGAREDAARRALDKTKHDPPAP